MKISYALSLLVISSAAQAQPAFDPPKLPERKPLFAQQAANTMYSDFGGVGLMQAPTARMAPDGDFAFAWTENDPYRLFTVNLQLLPRLEVTARYVLETDTPLGSGGDFVDKGFDAKVMLLRESTYVPQLAVGLRDVAGTGLFSGEYVVASKQLGPFDITAGIGWGYLGRANPQKNPLCRNDNSFCDRPVGFSGKGGEFEIDRFFKGDISPFGGISWQTPHKPLTLMVELDPNDYQQDLFGPYPQDKPYNVGLSYRVGSALDLRVAHERGNTTTFGVVLHTNFNRLTQAKRAIPMATLPETLPSSLDVDKTQQQLDQLAGFQVQSVQQSGDVLSIYGQQQRYRQDTDWKERAFRVLHAQTPESVNEVRIIESSAAQPLVAFEASRAELAQAFTPSDRQLSVGDVVSRAAPSKPAVGDVTTVSRSPWQFSGRPYLKQSLGGTDEFYFYELGVLGSLSYEQGSNLVAATVTGTILDNYDQFRVANEITRLQQVRSDVRSYLEDRPIRLDSLTATRFASLPQQSLYAQAYGGYLELMFAGVGGEVLYRPLDANWGIGIDVNRVRQRETDNDFGLQDYGVTTGHVTLYQRFPKLWSTQLKLSAGQYLAGDRGVTVDFSRSFDSGVTVGAYAAKTNVSAEDFGEGSFHKGFYLSIPVDLFTVRHSRARADFEWVPIQRDGGQKLQRPNQLWSRTQVRSPDNNYR